MQSSVRGKFLQLNLPRRIQFKQRLFTQGRRCVVNVQIQALSSQSPSDVVIVDRRNITNKLLFGAKLAQTRFLFCLFWSAIYSVCSAIYSAMKSNSLGVCERADAISMMPTQASRQSDFLECNNATTITWIHGVARTVFTVFTVFLLLSPSPATAPLLRWSICGLFLK